MYIHRTKLRFIMHALVCIKKIIVSPYLKAQSAYVWNKSKVNIKLRLIKELDPCNRLFCGSCFLCEIEKPKIALLSFFYLLQSNINIDSPELTYTVQKRWLVSLNKIKTIDCA